MSETTRDPEPLSKNYRITARVPASLLTAFDAALAPLKRKKFQRRQFGSEALLNCLVAYYLNLNPTMREWVITAGQPYVEALIAGGDQPLPEIPIFPEELHSTPSEVKAARDRLSDAAESDQPPSTRRHRKA